ncbi:MAG: C4-dicarboxylate TRAP transporter large permease protein DctM [Alphaproteobacteria bacterium MarineAlpha9_Bin6]|nr:MAG: C4-dicarboxylate TRAP transporter large permease protein DctM [Alphaproteobacteria bacterium MarineAlpha9_Bin6]HIB56294.1 TRAP transporter large permease subunit [Alphaproteobacteria bacterium]
MSGLFLEELFVIGMVLTLCGGLLMGFPVAFTLSGVALLAALLGNAFNIFELVFVAALPNRMYGIMTNDLLIAVPLFIFMGVMLERSKLAEELLETIALLLSGVRAGLGIAVTLVGGLLAASTGIVGATVVTMGLLSLPTMLKRGYAATVACGSICAAGTLGQIIPPSIVLILLGDQISAAYQQAQLAKGNFAPEPVSVADLFVGALLPGLGLVLLYIIWQFVYATIYPEKMPSIPAEERAKIGRGEMMGRVVRVLLPPLFLIVLVLGSILVGLATPTEAAGVGAMGAMLLAATRGQLTRKNLTDVMQTTAKITAMVFVILIGAQLFSLVFRGFGGDDMVAELLESLPGGVFTAMFLTMALIFFLGFFLDFIEICFVVIPIVGPAILAMDVNPVWFAIMIAVNVQTSFLTPPFGFSLFYLRGVAPPEVTTMDIYRGVVPFVFIQLGMLCILALIPELATWLPKVVYG